MKPRVSIEEVSRLVDGQVTDAERTDIEERLATCPVSQALKLAFEQLAGRVQEAVLHCVPPAPTSGGEECIDDATLARLADDTLPDGETSRVEQHLVRCRRCLSLVMQNLRTAYRMADGTWPAIPESAIQSNPSMRALVNWQARTEERAWETVRFDTSNGESKQTVGSGHLSATILIRALDRGGASIEMMVKERLRSFAGQEVIVTDADSHRKIFSGRTNAHGHVTLKRVPAGRYQLHFTSRELRVEIHIED